MNYFLSFNDSEEIVGGVKNKQNKAPQQARTLRSILSNTTTKIRWRGVSGNLVGIFNENQKLAGIITRFILKTVYDYTTTPATATDESKPYAQVKLTTGKTIAISLREDQSDLKEGQSVTVQAGTTSELNGKDFLGGEIL